MTQSETLIHADAPPEQLLWAAGDALHALQAYQAEVVDAVRQRVWVNGKVDARKLDAAQREAHGAAWIATYISALEAMSDWASRLFVTGRLGIVELALLRLTFGEYIQQIAGGVPISQVEAIRPADYGLVLHARAMLDFPGCKSLCEPAALAQARATIVAGIASGNFGDAGYDDELLGMMANQFRRFVEDRVSPAAHGWHLRNDYIPLELIDEMAALGVFGLTVPEEWGGTGLGKLAMAVVTEELSRGYIGVGSLGTRAEIAGELIKLGGTERQKQKYLARIASGEILCSAVFTEPDTGSDLASLRTRAELFEYADGKRVWRVTGNKTWITHAARADLMTILVRTDPDERGYKGLSMLIAEKPRGTEGDLFPADGMSGGEIEVLGYRGMKEFELGFDSFEVPEENLLGEIPGRGFKQLMETFEGARIQTAARAVGVAQNALELGLRYACERKQFGKPLIAFPRISDKLAWMAAETMLARQITYFSAREKDQDKRCDVEAGMAKLLAARAAWSNADSALQVHGGNGFALEYDISRVLCDARILSIFEGAAEIQAQVIARSLLDRPRDA